MLLWLFPIWAHPPQSPITNGFHQQKDIILVEDRKFVSSSSSAQKQGFVCSPRRCLSVCLSLTALRIAAIRKHLEPLYANQTFIRRPQILLFLLTHTQTLLSCFTYIFTIAKTFSCLWSGLSRDLIWGSRILMIWYHISLLETAICTCILYTATYSSIHIFSWIQMLGTFCIDSAAPLWLKKYKSIMLFACDRRNLHVNENITF